MNFQKTLTAAALAAVLGLAAKTHPKLKAESLPAMRLKSV